MEKGYEAVTIQDITDRADLGRGTFYIHFKDKEEAIWSAIEDGLRAVKTLKSEGIKTNVTLCFNSIQALMAAKAGATFISPFIGRLDDIASEGMEVVEEIAAIYANYDFSTEIIVASIRNPLHIKHAALIGADAGDIEDAAQVRRRTVPVDELILFLEFEHQAPLVVNQAGDLARVGEVDDDRFELRVVLVERDQRLPAERRQGMEIERKRHG